jgi:hypothetical protein
MIPLETVPEIRGEGIGKRNRGEEFKYDIFDTL